MDVTEVAVRVGVHRATVHRWVARYLSEQLGGLADRSHRPKCSPNQVSEEVEVAIAEIRWEHPRVNGGLTLRLKADDVKGVLDEDDIVSLRQTREGHQYAVNCPLRSSESVAMAVELTKRALEKVRK